MTTEPKQTAELSEYIEATRALAKAQQAHELAKQRFLKAQQTWQATILEE